MTFLKLNFRQSFWSLTDIQNFCKSWWPLDRLGFQTTSSGLLKAPHEQDMDFFCIDYRIQSSPYRVWNRGLNGTSAFAHKGHNAGQYNCSELWILISIFDLYPGYFLQPGCADLWTHSPLVCYITTTSYSSPSLLISKIAFSLKGNASC